MYTDTLDVIDEIKLPDSYKNQNSIRIPDFSVWKSIFAVSRDYVRAAKSFSIYEMKALAYALAEVDFTNPMPDAVVLDKRILANAYGLKTKSNSRASIIRKKLKKMDEHSEIELRDEHWELTGEKIKIIDSVDCSPAGKVIIYFTENSKRLFGNLQDGSFLTMSTRDIFRMRKVRSFLFYEFLRYKTNTQDGCNSAGIGIKMFKTLFLIPKEGKGSYMREKGGFDRDNFERKVIAPVCEDLKRCQMIKVRYSEGKKTYIKQRDSLGQRVTGYEFTWDFCENKDSWNLSENIAEKSIETADKKLELKTVSIEVPVINEAYDAEEEADKRYEEAMSEIDFESLFEEAINDMDAEEIMDINNDIERLSCLLLEINDGSILNNNATEVSILYEEKDAKAEPNPSNTVSEIRENQIPELNNYTAEDLFFEDMNDTDKEEMIDGYEKEIIYTDEEDMSEEERNIFS